MEDIYGFYFAKDKIVEICYDYDTPQNPRIYYDNLFTIYTWSDYYDSPDENIPFDSFFEDFDETQYLYEFINIDKGYLEINNNQKTNIDVKGIAFISKEDLKKEYNCKYITKKIIDKAFDMLHEEIKVYNNYLSGLIFYGNSYSFFGNHINSCSGFFGTDFDKNGFYEIFGIPKQEFFENFEIKKINEYIDSDDNNEKYLLYLDHLKEKYKINIKNNIIEFQFNEHVELFFEKNLEEELQLFLEHNIETFSDDIKNFIFRQF